MRISTTVFVIFAAFSAVFIACGSDELDQTRVPTATSDRVQPTAVRPIATSASAVPTATASGSGFPDGRPVNAATATARPASTPQPHPTSTPQPVTVPGSRYRTFVPEPDYVRPTPNLPDSVFFQDYGVNPFVWSDEERFSTFGMDVDTASYTISRAYILDGNRPPEDAVRVEEFVNYFEPDYPDPEQALQLYVDGAESPFGEGTNHLLRIGVAAQEISNRERQSVALIFVVDVSGSMAREGRLRLAKRSLERLVDNLDRFDTVGIVAYDDRAWVVLDPTSSRRQILDAIDSLRTGGSTNAEAGLVLGYNMASENFDRLANNRVILISDGVANVGRTGSSGILHRIGEETRRGITLTAIGVGIANYNDVLLEQLADNGNGNYYYIDDDQEARKLFGEDLISVLQPVASDAKIQVEFNPEVVERFRLIGYENRGLETEDFRDNTVDAGEVGAGHRVTALYEVRLRPRTSGPVATVSIRYRDVETGDIHEVAREIYDHEIDRRFGSAEPDFQFIAAVAEFAEVLRGSPWSDERRLDDIWDVADEALREMSHGDIEDEFLTLVSRMIRMDR